MPEIVQQFDDKSIMPFGTHKGKAMANVPARVLLWYHDNIRQWLPYQVPVKKYIEANLDVIKRQVQLSEKAKQQRSNAGK